MPDVLDEILNTFDAGRSALKKHAFISAGPPQGPASAPPPGGPPPPGPGAPPPPGPGAPPPPGGGQVDPNTGLPIDPQSGMPMDPQTGQLIDPQTGQPVPPPGPGAPPPPGGDPNAGGAPPPPQEGGAVPPELENALSQMSSSVESVANTVEQQQQQSDELTKRMLTMEDELSKLKEDLKNPAPFEGGPEGGEPTPEQAGDSGALEAIAKGASYEHSSNLLAALPGGSIIKSVGDDESFGEWAGRGALDATGGYIGATGLGALTANLLKNTDLSDKAKGISTIAAALGGGATGSILTDKLYDKLMDKRIRNRKIKKREDDYEDQKKGKK